MVRIKERYLLVDILYPNELDSNPKLPDVVLLNQPTTDALTPQALLRGIRAEVASLFGDFGSGTVEGGSLSVKYLSPATSTFILRISRAHYRIVWTALTMMDHVPANDGRPCVFRVVHVSGTIRKAEEEAVRRARLIMLTVKDQLPAKHSDALNTFFADPQKKFTRKAASTALEADHGVFDVGDVSSEDEAMRDYSDG